MISQFNNDDLFSIIECYHHSSLASIPKSSFFFFEGISQMQSQILILLSMFLSCFIWWTVNGHCISILNKSGNSIQRTDTLMLVFNTCKLEALFCCCRSQLINWVVQHNLRGALKSKFENTKHELLQVLQSNAQVCWIRIVFILLTLDNFRVSYHLVLDLALN